MPNRWPLHPPPYSDESLSSWIGRIANTYSMDLEDFLSSEFGINIADQSLHDIDLNPPPNLLTKLSECTGVRFEVVRALTAQVYIPLLIDTLKGEEPNSFYDYVNQFNVFPGKRNKFLIAEKDWVPWLNINQSMTRHGCKLCLQEDHEAYLRLYWRFSWMMTYPKHKTLLSQVMFYRAASKTLGFYFSENNGPPMLYSLDDLCAMDSITLQAVTKGSVEVPSGTLHGGVWLRMLRSLIEELSSLGKEVGQKNRCLMVPFWKKLNLSIRQGFGRYRLFEKCDNNAQVTLMLVASVAIKAIFLKQINFSSNGVNLLSPPVIYDHDIYTVYPGLFQASRLSKKEEREIAYVEAFKNLRIQTDELIVTMRSDPEVVISFRNMMRSFDSKVLPKIDQSLKELGIKII